MWVKTSRKALNLASASAVILHLGIQSSILSVQNWDSFYLMLLESISHIFIYNLSISFNGRSWCIIMGFFLCFWVWGLPPSAVSAQGCPLVAPRDPLYCCGRGQACRLLASAPALGPCYYWSITFSILRFRISANVLIIIFSMHFLF